ncbi:DNA polymerase III subunit epsilon [Methylobacterium sp. D53M]
MSREICLDTETTGVDHKSGDRIVEVACVELLNHVQTGRTFHRYVNPEREVPAEAAAVHGLNTGFLADKPLFAEIVGDLLAFIDGAPLVIHNASFDAGFLNMEFRRLAEPSPKLLTEADVIDTLQIARRKHVGASNTLDALCDRYRIDRGKRTKHGALLDAQLLAEVYLELLGGKQSGLDLGIVAEPAAAVEDAAPTVQRTMRSRITEAEIARHAAFVASLGEKAVWRDYLTEDEA